MQLSAETFSVQTQNRGGHLVRHLELHTYSSVLESLFTGALLLRV